MRKVERVKSNPAAAAKPAPALPPQPVGTWTFLTNHSHVLICLAKTSDARVRDIAREVGITERAVQKILRELELGRVIERFREGRRNRYEIHLDRPLRHPVEAHCTVRTLLEMVSPH